MSRAEDLLNVAFKELGPRPAESASQQIKKRFSERLSEVVAYAFAAELRARGLRSARPNESGGTSGSSGAERRMAGGIGAGSARI